MNIRFRVAVDYVERERWEQEPILMDVVGDVGGAPFWLTWKRELFEILANIAPYTLSKVRVSLLHLTKDEMKDVDFFEIRPGKLIHVTDEDFEIWDREKDRFDLFRSPDGVAVRVPKQLVLERAFLKFKEIGCPESGEDAFIATKDTIRLLSSTGLRGVQTGVVISTSTNDLEIIQASTILRSSDAQLCFGVYDDANGCRIVDRSPTMVLGDSNGFVDRDIALLPESRDSCSGTLVVNRRFVDVYNNLGLCGLRFSPVLVAGSDLWERVNAEWSQFLEILAKAKSLTET